MIKKVSICVLFYNQEKFVEKTLKSLLNQDYSDYEILIRDDCSSDSTQKIIKRFLNKNEYKINIKVDYGNENIGIIKSLNKLLDMCSGELILLCGGDDISVNNRVSRSIELINKYKVDMIACDARIIDQDENLLLESFYIRNENEINRIKNDEICKFKEVEQNVFLNKKISESHIGSYCLGGFGIAFNKGILDYYNGFFPENISYEDRFITFLASINNGFIWLIEPLVYYRRTQNNVSMPKANNIEQIKNNMCKLIAMETEVCKEQSIYLEKNCLKNKEYDKEAIIQYLRFEENRNKLLIKSIDKYKFLNETRLELLIKLIKNPKATTGKKIKSVILFFIPIIATSFIKKKYIKRKKFFMN